MKPGGGKQKGAGFEREVCKKLSDWISGGERTDLFWRSAMSGGRATIGLRKGEKVGEQAGDISPIHQAGHALTGLFVLECKFYNDLQFQNLIFSRNGGVAEFWLTVAEIGAELKKRPLLIAKQNHYPTLMFLESRCSRELDGLGTDIYRLPHSMFKNDSYNVFCCDFDRFLEVIHPEFLARMGHQSWIAGGTEKCLKRSELTTKPTGTNPQPRQRLKLRVRSTLL